MQTTTNVQRREYAAVIARGCIECCNNVVLGKGKARDNAALHYFCGATELAAITGDQALTSYLASLLFLISAQGFKVVEDLANSDTIVAGA